MKKFIAALLLAIMLIPSFSTIAEPQEKRQATSAVLAKKEFTVAWSIYVGWMPWPYAEQEGILKKWADKEQIKIVLKQMDYVASLEAYVAKKVDAVTATNMETLDMPAAAGVDSTVIIAGDFSNGNDAVLASGIDSVAALKGQQVSLVENTVSSYLLARALEMNGGKESDVKTANASDSDIASTFLTNGAKKKAIVTWNPMLMQVAQAPGVKKLFDSSKIPGEIMDLMVVNTEVLKNNPALGRALTGAWYEVMTIMSRRGPEANKARDTMAKLSGCIFAEFEAQLSTTAMYWTPKDAHDFMTGQEIQKNMNYVRQYCFSHKLLGENTASVDDVAILYPDGTVQGKADRVRMRFDSSFTKLAMDGKLTR